MKVSFKKGSGSTVIDSGTVRGDSKTLPVVSVQSVESGRHKFSLTLTKSKDIKVGVAKFGSTLADPMTADASCWCLDLGTGECYSGGKVTNSTDIKHDVVEIVVILDCDSGTLAWSAVTAKGEKPMVAQINDVPHATPLCLAIATSDCESIVTWNKYEFNPSVDSNNTPEGASGAVFVESEEMPENSVKISGYDFNKGVDYHALLQSFLTTGFQATNFGRAVQQINLMRKWRLSDESIKKDEAPELRDMEVRKQIKTKIFFGYTSNLISSGTREQIRYLVEHKMVDVVVTTAGGVEEDFIKCLAPTYSGDFKLDGVSLRKKGINRIGNMLVPNKNYCLFEDWLMPILDKMLEEQKEQGTVWTPSKMIHRMGKEIDDPSSVYYWAYKNNIPVYSPAITDGSIGDMVYFHSFNNPGLVIDLVGDIRGMNDEAVNAKGKTGILCLGGGVIKHHIHNANLMRNGADFAVVVNTAQEFDGSDSGANPDEAKSWGKIRMEADPVKVYGEASIIFPLLVAETFARSDSNE